jgi:hypothetical protein
LREWLAGRFCKHSRGRPRRITSIWDRESTIKLTKDGPDAGGEDHYIPLAWVVHAEIKVHLRQRGDDAKARWNTH